MSTQPLTAVARSERALARAWVFIRLNGLAGVVLLGLMGGLAHDPSATAGGECAVGAVVLESALLSGACLYLGQIRSSWMAADLVVTVLARYLNGWAEGSLYGFYFNFMTIYMTTALIGLPIGLRRWESVGMAVLALESADFSASMLFSGQPHYNLVFNGVTQLPTVIAAWAVSSHVRRTARELDASRAETVELVRQKERSWHARALHDRVLQTLEGIIRHEVIPPGALRWQIEADTAWLRALVEGAAVGQRDDLHWRLREVVERHTAGGLRVEFNGAQLQRSAQTCANPPGDVVDAVAEAVGEALTNTAKHAGVDTAVLHAALTDLVVIVSVLDHGSGFDPATTRRGLGLDQSITARIHEAGGHVRIDSSPGHGTYVEITVPTTTALPDG